MALKTIKTKFNCVSSSKIERLVFLHDSLLFHDERLNPKPPRLDQGAAGWWHPVRPPAGAGARSAPAPGPRRRRLFWFVGRKLRSMFNIYQHLSYTWIDIILIHLISEFTVKRIFMIFTSGLIEGLREERKVSARGLAILESHPR